MYIPIPLKAATGLVLFIALFKFLKIVFLCDVDHLKSPY